MSPGPGLAHTLLCEHHEGAELIRRTCRRDDRGTSAVEYALLVAGVAALLLVISVSLTAVIRQVMVSNCEQTAKQNLTSSADANCDR